MPRYRVVLILGAVLLSACNRGKPQRASAIGIAYAGPATLNLHKDIDSKSPTVGIAHHGDKLEIVGLRRRWYLVRTEKSLEGWTSDRELLDSAQMARLRTLAAQTAGMPSQGVATTFGLLNIHTEPNRQSPSFAQVKENEKMDVIAHRVAPRGALPKRQLLAPKPKLEKKKVEKKAPSVPPPPAPEPPPPPPDWIDLSKNFDPPPMVDSGPIPTDDWTLIRTSSGQTGWVLTSGLYLAIPDEVAQYAEGHRITSYFSLGQTEDRGSKDEKSYRKDIWLWTTSERLGEDHDFDGFRVFAWSTRRHRYETAFIQRRERGFFPVLAKPGEFSVCLEKPDGSRVRKKYVILGVSVRGAGETACEKPVQQEAPEEQNLVPGFIKGLLGK